MKRKKIQWLPERIWHNPELMKDVFLDNKKAEMFFDFVQENKGYIYAMKNTNFPGLLKIGLTKKNPFVRAQTLKSAGAMGDFEPMWIQEFPNVYWAEIRAHTKLKDFCVDREWFEVSLEKVKETFLQIEEEDCEILRNSDRKALLSGDFSHWLSFLDFDSFVFSDY